MSAPRAVISDFGGVLTTPLGNAFAAWSEESGVSLEALGKALAASADRHGEHPLFVLERGEIPEREFVARIEAELGSSLDGVGEALLGKMERNHAMIDFLADLPGRGLRTALLTNNVREWEPRWRAMLPEIDTIFEVVVDSAFVGMRKPEHEIYHLTLERLGGRLDAEQCVFVDDLAVNCEAAREVGMTAVLFETTEQAVADIERALAGG